MKSHSHGFRWHRVAFCGLVSLGMVMATNHIVHAERYSFTDLDDLGGGRSFVNAINNAGQAVGWSTVPGNKPHAFLYKDRNMLSLSISGIKASANGINGSEQVVGQTGDGHPFLYDHGNVTIFPGLISGGYGAALGINTAGQVVGYANTSSTRYAVLFSPGKAPVNLNVWGGRTSVAYGINDAGQVVGEAATPDLGAFRAFRYDDNGTMTDLGTLGGRNSAAYAINNAGQVVGASEFLPGNTTTHAVLYNPGEKPKELVGPSGLASSVAKGINKFGHVVGWFNIAGYQRRAFIYKNGTMQDLNSLMDSTGSGWTLSQATAINDKGQIVGHAIYKNGKSHGFLLTPLP